MIRPFLMAVGVLAAVPAFAQAGAERDPAKTEVWAPVADVAPPVGAAPD